MRVLADGTLEMGGRKLNCPDAETRIDRRLPNLGAASPDEQTLWLNPRMLARETPTVRLFVFHHECGHIQVGPSELGSDCWAVTRGVEAGWLDREGLQEVCDSFEDAPETSTHPSGKRRCANLDRCFAAASAKKRPAPKPEVASAPATAPVPAAAPPAAAPAVPAVAPTTGVVAASAPRLVQAPKLLWTGETDSE